MKVTSICSSNSIPVQKDSRKHYGIGITGFSRITNPHYNRRLKCIWVILFLSLSIAVSYQIGSCFYEYCYGAPAVGVTFVYRPKITFPRILICPLEFFGKNPITISLYEQYKRFFNLSTLEFQDINFSDFLRLPNVSIRTLWNMMPIKSKYVRVYKECSPFKNDESCADPTHVRIEDLDTIGGQCVSIRRPGEIFLHGPVSYFGVEIIKSRLSSLWMVTDSYLRGWSISEEENPRYVEINAGMPLPFSIHARILIEEIEEINLNHPLFPCEDGYKVESCIDKCIEGYLYSQVSCSLPFMKNISMSICKTAEEFNKTFEISKQILRKRKVCQEKCPRRCFEAIHILNAQISRFPTDYFQVRTTLFGKRVQRIYEYHWYTFTSLLADIGGSLGFFIDVNVLSLAEIIEVSLEICTKCFLFIRKKIPNNGKENRCTSFRIIRRMRKMQHKKPNSFCELKIHRMQGIKISITGTDRLTNPHVSQRRKYMWIICVCASVFLCGYQVISAIYSYRYGDPDIRTEIQKNESVKFPAITICPHQPFEYSEVIEILKEKYRWEFNSTRKSSNISVPDLLRLPSENLDTIWNGTGINKDDIKALDVYCNSFTKMQRQEQQFNSTFTEHFTIHGKCLTIEIVNQARFVGPATVLCFMLSNLPKSTAEFPLHVTLHQQEDDPRTFDPFLGIPLSTKQLGVWSIHARKRELLNRPGFPCKEGSYVSQCRSQCFDRIMEQKTSCRLPFMKNMTYESCNTSEELRNTMDNAVSFLKNLSENKWCNCPRKCQEYIYGVHRNDMRLNVVPVNVIFFQFPNNIFLATKEYSQMTPNALFANICGSLGLFLGFNALTIVEILEAIWILLSNKLLIN